MLRYMNNSSGARIWNAATSLNVPVSDIAEYFDSLSVCLSKGLGEYIEALFSYRQLTRHTQELLLVQC